MSLANTCNLLGRSPTASSLQIGNVDGPASSTDNAVVRWDGTTGRLLQNSVLIVADTTGALSGFTTGAGITFHGGGTLTGASGVLRLSGNTLLGGLTTVGTGVLQFPTASTSAGGITLGDVNIFQIASNQITISAANTFLGGSLYSVTGANLSLNTNSGGSGLSIISATGATRIEQAYLESTTTLSGPGAVSVAKITTKVTTTGVANALTLADGTNGQIVRVIHDVDGGSFVLTPTTKTGWSTFTSTAVGESITLQFVTTRGWIVVGSYLGTIAP